MAVLIVTFDQVTAIPRREDTKWLDEREVCPLVNRRAHGGRWAEFEERCKCDSYYVGYCSRAGRAQRVNCAFEDKSFDWQKAADWQEVAGGGMLYAPEENPRKRRKSVQVQAPASPRR